MRTEGTKFTVTDVAAVVVFFSVFMTTVSSLSHPWGNHRYKTIPLAVFLLPLDLITPISRTL